MPDSTIHYGGLQEADRWADSLVQEGVFSAEQGESLKLQGAQRDEKTARRQWMKALELDPHQLEVPATIPEEDRSRYEKKLSHARVRREADLIDSISLGIIEGEVDSVEELESQLNALPFAVEDNVRGQLMRNFVEPFPGEIDFTTPTRIARRIDTYQSTRDGSGKQYSNLKRAIALQPPAAQGYLRQRLEQTRQEPRSGDPDVIPSERHEVESDGNQQIVDWLSSWRSSERSAGREYSEEVMTGLEWHARARFHDWVRHQEDARGPDAESFLNQMLPGSVARGLLLPPLEAETSWSTQSLYENRRTSTSDTEKLNAQADYLFN